jgi:hypothetical protein
MKHFIVVLMLAATVAVSGCTKLKKLTGQTNDTVLPGSREDILPPDQQTARDPVVTRKTSQACDPTITQCPPDLAPQ